ncbi:MAG: TA system VapC family ribonuclease toxin [Anaerolineae bacterium]
MTTYLLDVNVLLALSDPAHIHHEAAHRWFAATGFQSWATCPITQNGFVRIASHPNYPNRPGDVPAVYAILRQLCQADGHQFWPEDISILEILESTAIITHAQITDVYLAGLAAHRQGKLATLDRHIPIHAVRGGEETLELIPV